MGTERALDKALSSRCSDLRIASGRLKVVPSHDALILLRSSFSLPRLMHTLRCVPLAGHPSLTVFDNLLREGISSINSILSDIQWQQASLPIRDGGLGIRRATRWHFSPFWLPPRAHRISSTVSCHHVGLRPMRSSLVPVQAGLQCTRYHAQLMMQQ